MKKATLFILAKLHVCPKLSGKGNKRIASKMCVRKTLTEYIYIYIYAEFLNFQDAITFIPAILLTNMTNECSINRIVNKTFEEIDSFSKLITMQMQNFFYE